MNILRNRSIKISAVLKKEISSIILRKINDPRIIKCMVTILDVTLSKDLSYSTIFVGFVNLKKPTDYKKIIKLLQNCSGYIRTNLSKKVKLRIIPTLKFKYDNSFMIGSHISSIIKKIK